MKLALKVTILKLKRYFDFFNLENVFCSFQKQHLIGVKKFPFEEMKILILFSVDYSVVSENLSNIKGTFND